MSTRTAADEREPATTLAELLDALEDRPPLGVDADLTVAVDGAEGRVVGYGDLVAVDLPSLPAALTLRRSSPADPTDAAAALASVDLTVEVRVRGVPVGRIGADAAPGRVARLLGLGPVELVPEGALLALTRRRG
ncbi:hypothetical protein [Haloarcula litorea]|uniref:hypothetical protein n=1 Tax=Haloarcula litorea TaxID=3032579 RepID=UPI0023E85D62|nr:hypothetical protein [Halomicroarcula sp. GDY20]